jgi:hypothetical protein
MRTCGDESFRCRFGLDGFGARTSPSRTQSPGLSKRKDLDFPDHRPELLLASDQDSDMGGVDMDVDAEDSGASTPTSAAEGGVSPHSRPPPRRRVGFI